MNELGINRFIRYNTIQYQAIKITFFANSLAYLLYVFVLHCPDRNMKKEKRILHMVHGGQMANQQKSDTAYTILKNTYVISNYIACNIEH